MTFFVLRHSEYNLHGRQYSLEVQRSLNNIRSHFFSQRIVKHRYALPDHVVSATSVNIFKNRLDSCEVGNIKAGVYLARHHQISSAMTIAWVRVRAHTD